MGAQLRGTKACDRMDIRFDQEQHVDTKQSNVDKMGSVNTEFRIGASETVDTPDSV